MIQLRIKIKEQNRAWVLYLIQLVFTSLMGVPVYTLAALLETSISTHRFLHTPLVRAILEVISGGIIVFVAGILIDRN
jgi:threonine/homoserine/homoserine lactone efflux protein